MNVQKEELPGCHLKVSVAFDAEEIDAVFARVFKDLAQQGRVPGFRPGKAPKALLIRQYGKDAINGSVFGELLQENLQDLLTELDVLGQPEFPDLESLDIAEGEPLDFEFTATVGPRVEVGDIAGVPVFRPTPEATDEEIAEVLEQLRETHAQETKPDRDTVQPGDAVDLELSITLDGDEDPVIETEETLIIGEEEHFPVLDDKLLGHIVGQSVEMEFEYPDDHLDDELAGHKAIVVADILALRERELPDLDDDFAKTVDEKQFESFDDLRTEIKRQLDEERADYSRTEIENQIAKVLLERSEVDLPDILVAEMVMRERSSLLGGLEESGMGIEEYRDMTGLGEGELLALQTGKARRAVKTQAIFEELAKQHAGEPTDEEVHSEIEVYAVERDVDATFVEQSAELRPEFLEELKQRITHRKVFGIMMESVDLQDISVSDYREKREELLKPDDEDEGAEPDDEDEGAEPDDAQEEPTDPDPADPSSDTDQQSETETDQPADESAQADPTDPD